MEIAGGRWPISVSFGIAFCLVPVSFKYLEQAKIEEIKRIMVMKIIKKARENNS